MASPAEVRLLYVQDGEPGFMWAGGHVVVAAEAERRQRIFGVLGQTVQKSRIDSQTPDGRVVWGQSALVVEAPLNGVDNSGRALSLTMAVLGDTRGASWHAAAVELADVELTAHGLELNRAGLEAVLREAQRLRPGPLLAFWLDSRHFLSRVWHLTVRRLSAHPVHTTKSPSSPNEQEVIDGTP